MLHKCLCAVRWSTKTESCYSGRRLVQQRKNKTISLSMACAERHSAAEPGDVFKIKNMFHFPVCNSKTQTGWVTQLEFNAVLWGTRLYFVGLDTWSEPPSPQLFNITLLQPCDSRDLSLQPSHLITAWLLYSLSLPLFPSWLLKLPSSALPFHDHSTYLRPKW